MKKGKIFFMVCNLFMLLLLAAPSKAEAGTITLSGWTLIDMGGHLDWSDGGTEYLSYFESGVNLWEEHRSGVIREDSTFTINDVVICDYNYADGYNAVTQSDGYVRFNKCYMTYRSVTQKKSIAAHEIGHCLGCGDTQNNLDIMYNYTPQISNLSENDKSSYDWIMIFQLY